MSLNRRGLRCLLLKVHLRDTLDILRLLLTIHLHRAGWSVKSNLHLVELTLGVVEVKLKVVELVLKEVDSGVTVHHRVLKLVNLTLELSDKSTPARKLVTGLTKLLVPQLDGQVRSLSLVNMLSGDIALEKLESVNTV